MTHPAELEFDLWESQTNTTHIALSNELDTLCGIPLKSAAAWLVRIDGLPEYASCRRCTRSHLKLVGEES